MTNRKIRLARAMAIGEKLWRLQQIRLAHVEMELAALRASEQAALGSLARLEPKLVLHHIADLANRRKAAESAQTEAIALAHEYGRRMKLTKRLHDEADKLSRREESAALLRSYIMRSSVSAP